MNFNVVQLKFMKNPLQKAVLVELFSLNVLFLFCNGHESNVINYYMNMIDAFQLARSVIRSDNIVHYNFNINCNHIYE